MQPMADSWKWKLLFHRCTDSCSGHTRALPCCSRSLQPAFCSEHYVLRASALDAAMAAAAACWRKSAFSCSWPAVLAR
jgi:hypothetical protein